MILFVDTNVLLDVLAKREPFYDASASVWSLVESGSVAGHVSAISFNNVYYIVRKAEDRGRAFEALARIRDVFDCVAPDRSVINQAIDSDCDYFEDEIQYHSAVRCHADVLISRNPGDFPQGPPTVQSPSEFLDTWPSAAE